MQKTLPAFIAVLFFAIAFPAHAAGSSLVWGGVSGSSGQVTMLDGGTYSVPLDVSAPTYVTGPLVGPDGELVFELLGHLYKITESGVRERVETLHPHDEFDDPDDPNDGDALFAWPSAGSYELDLLSFPAPQPFFIFEDRLTRWIAGLFFADVASAQVLPPPPTLILIETLHFTIEEAESKPDPVIIIPGILGSAQHNGVWLIDPITHAYDNLIDTLAANGYEKGVTLFPFPYEWRVSNRDTALLLKEKITEVKNICRCDKVDIVAHSMGGLVARQYIQSAAYDHDVDQLIFLGTPQLGAPKAYLMWEGGQNDVDKADQRIRMFLRIEAVKHGFADLFDYIRAVPIPSVQELLPVYGYIKHVGSPNVPPFSTPNWYPGNLFLQELNTNLGNLYNSGVEISNFVGQLTASTTITTIRVVAPTTTSPTLLWGFGFPDGFLASNGDHGLERGRGDATVPLSSASFVNQDLQIFDSEHSNLPTATEGMVFKKLTGKDPTTLVTGEDNLDVPILIFQILSPADFVVVAPNGLKVGKDFATGQELAQIPDAFYSGFGTDDEYVTIPNPLSGLYKVITQGTGNGGAFTVATGIIGEASSTEKFFTGQTLPGLLTTLNVDIGIGPSATIKSIQIVATIGSTQIDINRAYALGWLKSSTVRDSLLLSLTQAQKLKKQSDKIKLYNAMLEILKAAKKTNTINQQGYDLLTADVNWLVTH